MPSRSLFLVASFLFATLLLVAAPVVAQSSTRWQVPRTPDGKPDLQGNWSNATLTPIERPGGMGPTLTAQQVAMLESRRETLLDSLSQPSDPDRRAPPKGGVSLGDRQFDAASGGTGGYNVVYIDGGDRIAVVNGQHRSSLITRPADGRVPMTPAARARQGRIYAQYANFDHPESRPLAERCIMSFGSNAGPPMLPNYFYNNNYTVVQTADHVAILSEMIHDVRIIPIGGAPGAPSGRAPFMGISSGRWEADTLVIETTNINPEQAATFFGASAGLRVTERLTRTSDSTLLYRFTVEDPESFAEPWDGEVPFNRLEARVYEYACHEGNYALANILSGARYEERQKAAKPE